MEQPPPLPSDSDPGLPTPTPPPLPRPVVPLDYNTGRAPPRPIGPLLLRACAGFIVYIALSAGWFGVGIKARVPPRMVWSVWLGMTAGLLVLALHLRTRYNKAGYGYGILLALFLGFLAVVGLVLLIIGMCFK
jgi:hypothetical protein